MSVPTPTPASVMEQHEKFLQKLERMKAANARISMGVVTVESSDGKSSTSPSPKEQKPAAPSSKPFIRKPHLTQRPLAQHEGLTALRDKLTPRKQRPTNKKVAAVKSHKKESK